MLLRTTLRTGLLTTVAVVFASGCMPGQYGPPGSSEYQRYEATLHDPYPDQDLGPDVVGGRPRDFQKPLAEPVRNRWGLDSWWR